MSVMLFRAPMTALIAAGTLALSAAGAARVTDRPAKPAPAQRVVTVVARDYAFDAPDTIVAGRTEIQLVNRGTELHHAYLMRLDGDKHLADLLEAFKAGGPPPSWAHDVGGPNSPAPGATSAVALDLQPGTYAMICVIPSAGGVPHIMKGMSHEFTVVREAKIASLAGNVRRPVAKPMIVGAPDVTVELADYAFGITGNLDRGKHVVRVRNSAAQSHEMFIGRLAPGKTAADVIAWIEKPQGAAPILPLGGTVGLAKGMWNDIALDLTPGNYALFCFIPDAHDGKPHVAHGMIRSFTVR